MLNKKILAVAVAASFSFNASATIDIGDSTTGLTYASETILDGTVILSETTVIDPFVEVGVILPINGGGTEYYVRLELGNATFATAALDDTTMSTAAAGVKTYALAAEGLVGDDVAVFTYINNAETAALETFEFAFVATDLTVIDASLPVTYTYKLFLSTNAFSALNTGDTGIVATETVDAMRFITGQTSTFDATQNTALVAEGFTTFANTIAPALVNSTESTAVLGSVTIAAGAATILAADSLQATNADVFTNTGDVTASLTGDFSVGTWTMDTQADCAGAPVVVTVDENDNTMATAASADYTATQHLCVEVDGVEIIPRVTTAYTITLDDLLGAGISGTLGEISYDTTSIKVDYITVNTDYAQKIFLTNTSSSSADYTTSFTLESGSTATGGTGTVPANTMITVKASDFMIITGDALRGSAVIEIEGNVGDIQASTQTVNLTTKDTDTVTLIIE